MERSRRCALSPSLELADSGCQHRTVSVMCHNPIFDLFIWIIIILFTEKDIKNDDEKKIMMKSK